MDVSNYFALIFCFILPLGIVVGMAAVLIRDHVRAKRRRRRCHKAIETWQDLRVDK